MKKKKEKEKEKEEGENKKDITLSGMRSIKEKNTIIRENKI